MLYHTDTPKHKKRFDFSAVYIVLRQSTSVVFSSGVGETR